MATLITAKRLNKALKSINTLKLDVTLSLAFYGLVHGNVSALHGEEHRITGDFHRDYKALVPASFDKNSGEWVYNKTKAQKLNAQFGIVFGETTFEEFCDLVCLENDKKPELSDQEKRDKACTSVQNAIVKALTMGIDRATLTVILANAQAK